MGKLEYFQEILKREKAELKEKYKLKEIGIFGSYVRKEESKSSDLDILVDYEEVPTLFELVELRDYLSDILKIKVDLVMKSGLKPRIGSRILKEVVFI